MRKSWLVGLAFLGLANTAHASGVQLFDVNAAFADGSVLTGSFDLNQGPGVFDQDQYSNISLTLTGSHFDQTFDEVASLGTGSFVGSNELFTIQFGNSANTSDTVTFVDLSFLLALSSNIHPGKLHWRSSLYS